MSETKDKAKGRGKGVAFGKWAKIDKAQRNMFIAVCIASMILGITIVAIIYFSKVIAFNGTLIKEKDSIIGDYKSIQSSLQSISGQINDMTNNERLEVVARTRSNDCAKSIADNPSDDSIKQVEVARTCTSLRVIPDALPSSLNTEATLASLNQLLIWSDPSLNIEGITENDPEALALVDESGSAVKNLSLKATGASLSLEDDGKKIHAALDTIERSVRNFDITSANISWAGGQSNNSSIELRANFRSYYSSSVNIESKKKKVCADNQSEKCTGKKSSGGKKK